MRALRRSSPARWPGVVLLHLYYCAHLSGAYNRRTSMAWSRFIPGTRLRKKLLAVVVVLLAAECVFSAYIYHVMRRPPEAFGAVMAKLPQPYVFMLVPFEPLWMRARAGALHPGDSAPDFSLAKIDHSGTVELATLNKNQPVVLVFGSYT